jgi:hypothetical protein
MPRIVEQGVRRILLRSLEHQLQAGPNPAGLTLVNTRPDVNQSVSFDRTRTRAYAYVPSDLNLLMDLLSPCGSDALVVAGPGRQLADVQ